MAGGKLVLWTLNLQQYDLKMKYIKGKKNKVADADNSLPIGEVTPPFDKEAFDIPHLLL